MPDDSEFRQDAITKQWVICAPTRSDRPKHFDNADAPLEGEEPVDGCPFCPGHEDLLPTVLFEKGRDRGDGAPESPGQARWDVRAVPNKFPALSDDVEPASASCVMFDWASGHGKQEVIIATPRHHQTIAQMPVEQVESLIATYRARYDVLRREGLIPFIFHNHGSDAGASLPHPHSQIIAPSIEPPNVADEQLRAKGRYDETGRCPYCEMIDEERSAGVRIVCETDPYVAFVPYAARVPYEVWILPTLHEPEFGRRKGNERVLARLLRDVLRALRRALGGPDFNFFVRTALEHRSDAPHLHWSLRIRPRISIDAGFEIGTGMKINPSLPERDADVLRDALS